MPAATKAAISADSPLTAEAGAQIARLGGNATDIAVAAALAATVSESLMCSLGGSGFFMIRMSGSDAELFEGADATPTITAPPTGDSDSWRLVNVPYGDGIQIRAGAASIAIPGMLAAADAAWRRHGKLPWVEIVRPALELSRREIPAVATMAKWLGMSGRLLFYQDDASRQAYFNQQDQPLTADEPFRIQNLDQTFQAIADEGGRSLYDGSLAEAFAREVQDCGGYVQRQDLANYHAHRRRPLFLESQGFRLALNPPPAVGGVAAGCLIHALQSNWRADISEAETAELLARAQLRLLQARQDELYRPGLDDARAQKLLDAAGLPAFLLGLRSPNTTHVSVATADGGLASVTMSMGYGAGIILPGLGIACNNSLGEPELNPLGFHNASNGTRLTSNMSPTVAWHPDGRCLAFGSPGASRITTALAQTWMRFALQNRTYEQAVADPRLHIELTDGGPVAQLEPGIDASLLGPDYQLRQFQATDMYFGAVKLTGLDLQGEFHAVADDRRHGAVIFVT